MDEVQQLPAANNPNTSSAPSRRRRWVLPWLLIALVAVGGGGASAGYFFFLRNKLPPDPRLTFKTPYRNVRPDVAYVGDGRCARCHEKEAQDYSKHPMGRSLAPMAEVLNEETLAGSAKNPFDFNGFRYEVIRRNNTVWHKESLLDTRKNVVYEKEMEVKFALGSGIHGKTYLHVENDRVWESPISWYTEKARWDLSPGYHNSNLHFNRPVTSECLLCHSNHVVPRKETTNAYQLPLFQGHAIGCERCHGAGELHVQRHETNQPGPDPDDTIVNPKHLEPTLREAVCQQCHLQGEVNVQRLGRDPADFRPGLPLHYFRSVYVLPADSLDPRKAVGQVEQMALSNCFQMSGGKLGCISCHDPHRLPPPEEKVSYYRNRCLSCHETSSPCSLPLPKRQASGRDDNCVGCHMPAKSSSNIVHASITDHRILKNLPADLPKTKPLAPGQEFPLVLFHRDLDDPAKFTRDRDAGIAMAKVSLQTANAVHLASIARGVLEKSMRQFPDDIDGGEKLAGVLWALGERQKAYQVVQGLIRKDPQERVVVLAARFAYELGRLDEALLLQERLVKLNPNEFDYQLRLADLLAGKEQWGPALAAAREAVRANPARLEPRRLIILCHLRLGQAKEARTVFETYRRFQPSDGEVIRRWFD